MKIYKNKYLFFKRGEGGGAPDGPGSVFEYYDPPPPENYSCCVMARRRCTKQPDDIIG